jgi:hypothetical protein
MVIGRMLARDEASDNICGYVLKQSSACSRLIDIVVNLLPFRFPKNYIMLPLVSINCIVTLKDVRPTSHR